MESVFRTGRQWNDSNYFIDVLELHFAPVAGSLVLTFLISLVFVCRKQKKEVHEFTRLFALITALTMLVVAYSYSLSDTTTLFRTRIDNALAFKNETTDSIARLIVILGDLSSNPFVRSCSAANLTICNSTGFFQNSSRYFGITETRLIDILATFENVMNPDLVAQLQSNLDMLDYYMLILEYSIYGLFIGVGSLIWISILCKIGGRYLLHGVGGLLSFGCLLLGLAMLLGSHGLADICKSPMTTLADLVTDPDIAFYFNCTPNPDTIGPFPIDFEKVKGLLFLEPFLDRAYLGVCQLDPGILDKPLTPEESLLKTDLRHGCLCDCNSTLIKNATQAIYSRFDDTGMFNTFECGNLRSYVVGLTDALCGYFSPFVGYFFLLVSLSGHALFLFYFVPKKESSKSFYVSK